MSERRYFSLFSERHVLGGKNKYQLIFDAICDGKLEDEEAVLKKLKSQKVNTDFFSADKNYLYSLVLRSLNDFHHSKTINFRLKEGLNSIEVLFHKGLYSQAVKLCEKLETLAEHCENYSLMLDILYWKKRCAGYTFGVYKAQEVNNQMDHCLDKVNNLKQITNLYYESYILKEKEDKTDKSEVRELFEQLIANPILASPENASSLVAKIFFNLIFVHYYYVVNDTPREYQMVTQTLDLIDENPWYKIENPIDYISVYQRIFPLTIYLCPHELESRISVLEKFAEGNDIQKEIIHQRVLLHTKTSQLEHLLVKKDYKNARNFIEDLKIWMEKLEYSIEPIYIVRALHLSAAFYLLNKEPNKALEYTNQILNSFKNKSAEVVYIRVELLNTMAHFDLGNYFTANTLSKKIRKKSSLSHLGPMEADLSTVLFKHTNKLSPDIKKLASDMADFESRYAADKSRYKNLLMGGIYLSWADLHRKTY